MFSTVQRSKQRAEAVQDEQSRADALSLLGQAHYFSTLNSSTTINSPQGNYHEAFTYQQQALERRETIHEGSASRSFSLVLCISVGSMIWRKNTIRKPIRSPTNPATQLKRPSPLVILQVLPG